MNPRLLIALALVLASVAWLQWQDTPQDDEGLLAAPRSSANRPTPGAPRASPTTRLSSSARAAQEVEQSQQRLVAAWTDWQARTHGVAGGDTPPVRASVAGWLTAAPPAPPRPERTEPPPPPTAPRFPHQWVGRFDDEATPGQPATQRAVVQGRQGTWVVQAGDVIESTWRVDRVQARMMQLTYLPLGQTQTVTMR